MALFESIADRRIREARRAGLFDNLPGAGKPIADLDRQRPPGWWGSRVVKTERDKLRYEDLKDQVSKAMPALWRLESKAAVLERVDELNDLIDAYNARTSFERLNRLDSDHTTSTWERLRPSGGGAGPVST